MRNVAIPDPIYDEAASRAAAKGQSLEALVLDALTSYLDDAPLVLTAEQLAKIERAEADIDAGRFYTPEQVDEQFAIKRAAWIARTLAEGRLLARGVQGG